MIKDFKTASILPFRLQPFIEGVCKEKKYKPNAAVRDILSKLPLATDDYKDELYETVRDIIELALAIDDTAPFMFYYRQGRVPLSVYYATIAGMTIDMNPDIFPNLPEDYAELDKQVKILFSDVTKIADNNISPNAKFSYKIQVAIALDNFLEQLRTGAFHPKQLCSLQFYEQHVLRAHYLTNHDDTLTQMIVDVVQKINFIFNYHDNEFCDFIKLGMKDKDIGANREALFDLFPDKDAKGRRQAFDAAYNLFLKKHENPDHDFLYDFLEKTLIPAKLLLMTEPDVPQVCVDYMIAHSALHEAKNPIDAMLDFGADIEVLHRGFLADDLSDEILAHYDITKRHLRSMGACLGIADLTFSTMHLGGDTVSSFFDSNDIGDLYAKLNDSKELEIDNPHLKKLWDTCRANTDTLIKNFIEQNPDAMTDLDLHPTGP